LIPAGFIGVEAQLIVWATAMIRPGAAMLVAPGLGQRGLPVQLRVMVALAIGVAASGRVEPLLPDAGMVSVAGVVLIFGEVIAGVALGLAAQIGYAAALVAGEIIAGAMGLSFAGSADAAGTGSVPVVSSILSVIAMLLFFAADGHLALIGATVDSYRTLPPGGVPLAELGGAVMGFGSLMFAAALAIALPVAFATLLVQLAMATLSRSAPQLNLFAIGLPASLAAGLVFLALGAPLMADAIMDALDVGLGEAAALAGQE
jgi:flagellar biosynthesis protein FliR